MYNHHLERSRFTATLSKSRIINRKSGLFLNAKNQALFVTGNTFIFQVLLYMITGSGLITPHTFSIVL